MKSLELARRNAELKIQELRLEEAKAEIETAKRHLERETVLRDLMLSEVKHQEDQDDKGFE